MDANELRLLDSQLEQFLGEITFGMGRVERREALKLYLRGLLLDGERKSMEPIAARLASSSAEVEAFRQRMQEAVSRADWGEREMFRRVTIRVFNEVPEIEALVVDDTGIPKKGFHSVGVARQYSGTLGRTENCQVVVTVNLASRYGGACAGARLYLPREWTNHAERLEKAGVPADVCFLEKSKIAIALIDDALEAGVEGVPVLADSAYGDSSEFRNALASRGLKYVVGVRSATGVWPEGFTPRPPRVKKTSRKNATERLTGWRSEGHKPTSVAQLAASLPATAWRKVVWSEGTRGPQSGYFAAVRVRTSHNYWHGAAPGDEQWLLCEKTRLRGKPTTYYLSNLPERPPSSGSSSSQRSVGGSNATIRS